MSRIKKALVIIKEDPDGTISAEIFARPTIGKAGYLGFLALVGFQAVIKRISKDNIEDEAQ